MNVLQRLSVPALVMLVAMQTARAFDTSRIADPAVRACAERALPSESARQIQRLEAVGKDGYVRESVREIFWKRNQRNDSRVLLRMQAPSEEKGVSVLVNDDADRNSASYMSYSPKIKRVRRVSGESVFSTIITSDLTYDDFSYFYRRNTDEQVERRDDTMLDEVAVHILETTKPRENAEYALVRFFIDQQKCVPLRTEFIAHNQELRKVLLADRAELKQVGERWVPYVTTMIDHKLGTRSIYTVQEIDIDPALDDSLFESSALVRGGN